jgi:poly(A) polymerase
VVRALREAGHVAYFAGGCVRDELLGRVPSDYDIATDATPDRIAKLLPRSSHVGAAFGVMLVHPPAAHASRSRAPSEVIEVATFRTDATYTDKRRPDAVTFSTPEADAARRDFTVNALFLDPFDTPHPGDGPLPVGWNGDGGGRVIDFVGGLADLQKRVLRAVGVPEQRLAEDHLRALRAVRLAAKLDFAIDPATADAIRAHAAELRGVSRERIGDELRMMFEHPSRAHAAALLHGLGLVGPVLMDSAGKWGGGAVYPTLAGLAEPVPFGVAISAWGLDLGVDPGHHAVRREFTDNSRRALCLSNEERAAVAHSFEGLHALRDATGWASWPIAKQKRFAVGEACCNGVALLSVVDPLAAARVKGRIADLAATPVGLAPPPILTGDHLVAMGHRPGPRFKAVLDAVYDAQLEGTVVNLEQARELAARIHV